MSDVKIYKSDLTKSEQNLITAAGYPKFDENNKLHCSDGPAMLLVPDDWNGTDILIYPPEGSFHGCAAYYWHGIFIHPELAWVIIMNPEQINQDFIDSLNNHLFIRNQLEREKIKQIAIERMNKLNKLKETIDETK